ncbi:RibD/ribG C-terminal domain [Prochlorococcus marinus str. MIT 9211]|uniref:RibD/ribG C-terminal domain n=1 Tax=Prochlorococcus marinus (strain MIT 9211) TaxID=93059 RepID=A9BCW4_PROM4|nr:RibD/ribG C-terminal domain [Prochlorococcus marinus str. MIT 9211]
MKLVLAISLDGRIGFSDKPGQHIGGKGDRDVLEQALAWSDATLMGAGTLRAHKNTCLIKNPKLIKQRSFNRKGAQPICIVVSKEANFIPQWPFFDQPIRRWLLTRKRIETLDICSALFENILEFDNNLTETLATLKKKGLSKIVLLGGPDLVESFLIEDKINELQITIIPKVLGGEKLWVNSNNLPNNLTKSNSWILKKTEYLEGNELMLQYIRNYA